MSEDFIVPAPAQPRLEGLDRRALFTATAAALLSVSTTAVAQQSPDPHAQQKGAQQQLQPPRKPAPAEPIGNRNRFPALVAATKTCANKGEACIKHCIAGLNQGDTTLVDCLKTSTAMIPIVKALERYATIEAKHLAELVKLCITVNEECEAECRRHEEHQKPCKECADACRACIAECNKVLDKLAV